MPSSPKNLLTIRYVRQLLKAAIFIAVIIVLLQGVKLSNDSQQSLSKSQSLRESALELRNTASQTELTGIIGNKIDIATLITNKDTEIENTIKNYILPNLKDSQQQEKNVDELRQLAEKAESNADNAESIAWRTNYIGMITTTFGSVLLGALIGDSVTKIWVEKRTMHRKLSVKK